MPVEQIAAPFLIWVVMATFALICLGGSCLLMWKLTAPTEDREKAEEHAEPVPDDAPVQRRGGLDRMRQRRPRRVDADEEPAPAANNNAAPRAAPAAAAADAAADPDADMDQDDHDDDDDDADDAAAAAGGAAVAVAGGRRGRKAAEKQRQKEERRAAREAQLEAQRQRKEREAREDEARRTKRAEQQAAEEEVAEQARKEQAAHQAELERARKAEYEQWKSGISVEREGTEQKDEEEIEARMGEFVEYIKSHKVVLLEDLASNFNLKTKDVLDRLKKLEAEEKISGVVDDRGKFIYITAEEFDAVARFIKKKGRVSIEAIAAESNKLINLNEKK